MEIKVDGNMNFLSTCNESLH